MYFVFLSFFFFFFNWHYTSLLHTVACDLISRVAPGRPAPPSYVSSRFASILCTTCLSKASTLTRPLRSDHHAVIITLIGCALGNCVRRSGTISSPSTVFSFFFFIYIYFLVPLSFFLSLLPPSLSSYPLLPPAPH